MAKIAVAWLNESDWPAWCALDDQLPPYEKWRAKIRDTVAEVEALGMTTEKITVEPKAFLEWCEAKGKSVGRDTRSAYAAEMLMRRVSAH